jgi:hypothetical protein
METKRLRLHNMRRHATCDRWDIKRWWGYVDNSVHERGCERVHYNVHVKGNSSTSATREPVLQFLTSNEMIMIVFQRQGICRSKLSIARFAYYSDETQTLAAPNFLRQMLKWRPDYILVHGDDQI